MPLKRPQDIRGHNSVEVTQLYIWEDEAGTNGSDSPFELFTEIDWISDARAGQPRDTSFNRADLSEKTHPLLTAP
jgi:hypothetical protein